MPILHRHFLPSLLFRRMPESTNASTAGRMWIPAFAGKTAEVCSGLHPPVYFKSFIPRHFLPPPSFLIPPSFRRMPESIGPRTAGPIYTPGWGEIMQYFLHYCRYPKHPEKKRQACFLVRVKKSDPTSTSRYAQEWFSVLDFSRFVLGNKLGEIISARLDYSYKIQ